MECSYELLMHIAKRFDRIIVTGSQRSGTTFCAKALAKELKYHHFDEMTFEADRLSRFDELIRTYSRAVFQAPALLHEMPNYQDGTLVVVMQRRTVDIVTSMERINWFPRFGQAEYNKFKEGPCPTPEHLIETKKQFSQTLKALHLPYTELKNFEGFVEKRINWGEKQTE